MKAASQPSKKDSGSKKELILELAAHFGVQKFTVAEVEQLRRQMIVRLGAAGKTSPEYIAEVLGEAGMRVIWATDSDAEDKYEEEFQDLLHFLKS